MLLFYCKFLVVAVDPFFGEFAEVFSPFVEFFVGIDGEEDEFLFL